MHHLTLNTGHTRVSPREEVSDQAIAACSRLLSVGEHAIPGVLGGYRLVVPACEHGWVGTVYQATAPVLTMGVARNQQEADEVWPALVALAERLPLGVQADRPAETPWVAAVLILSSPASEWLGDFERCLAWAWIEKQTTI